jgi:hypothetical protein
MSANTATTRTKVVNAIKKQFHPQIAAYIEDNIKHVRNNGKLLGIKGTLHNPATNTYVYIDTTAETGHAPAQLNSIEDLLADNDVYLWREVQNFADYTTAIGSDHHTATLTDLIDEVAETLGAV